MKLKIYIPVTILALASCQLLKKDKLTLKKLDQKEELEVTERRNTLSQQNQLVLIDSSHQDFMLLLWPKGKFTFSVAKGFEGEADKILIKGKQTGQKTLNIKQETKQDSISIKANYTKEKESITSVKRNKLNVGYNWTWVLIIPGCYVLYLLYKCYKRLIG